MPAPGWRGPAAPAGRASANSAVAAATNRASGAVAIAALRPSMARPWLSSDAGPGTQDPSLRRTLRKRPVRSSKASARKRRLRHAEPATAGHAEGPRMEQVHLECPGDVVRAVPVRRIRLGPDGVLADPGRIGQPIQVDAADRMERRSAQTWTATRRAGSRARRHDARNAAGDPGEQAPVLPADLRPDHPAGMGVGAAAKRRRATASSLQDAVERLREPIRRPGLDEDAAAIGKELAGVGIGRRHDRLGQRPSRRTGCRTRSGRGSGTGSRRRPRPRASGSAPRARRTDRRTGHDRRRRGIEPAPSVPSGRPLPRDGGGPGASPRR